MASNKGGVQKLDAVSEDRNWRDRVNNELRCNQEWVNNWGFFQGGSDNLTIEDAKKQYSINERIQLVQKQINQLNIKEGDYYSTSMSSYKPKDNIEQFFVKEYNHYIRPDLKAIDRLPQKGWEAEKKKWKPPKQDKK